jgi:two-component system nitrate/nitrite response regulator NarL
MNASVRRSKVEQLLLEEQASEIQSLLRLLVSKISLNASSDKTRSLDGGTREILLDTDIDGVRCLLVRTDKTNHTQVALSPREQAIARMVAEGHPNKAIAATLEISAWTVSTHLRRIFAKFGVGSRAAMVAHLIESGLLVEHLDKTRLQEPDG